MERLKKNWSLLILALPYVITVLLPIISVIFLSNIVLNDYHEKIITDKQRSVEAAFNGFEYKISSIERLSYVVSQNEELAEYMYASMNKVEHTAVDYLELRNTLNSFMINNDVAAMYFYDIRGGRIISADMSLNSETIFFKYIYQQTEYTPEESVERLKTLPLGYQYSPAMKAQLNYKETEVIEYSISLPLAFSSSTQGILVFVIEVEDIFKDYEEILSNGGEIYVYDNKDNLIYSSGDEYENLMDINDICGLRQVSDDEHKIYGMVCHSDNRLWKVKAYIPNPMAESGLVVEPYFWMLVVVPIIVSIIFCVYFTHKNHKEISGVIKLFKGHDEASEQEIAETVGYNVIKEYASKVILENRNFKEQINSYSGSHKYEVLDKLVRNTYESREEISREIEKIALHIKEGKVVVLCIRYEGAGYRTTVSDGGVIKDFVKDLMEKLINRQFELFDTSARETICILAIEDQENLEITLRDIISSLNVEISYSYGIQVKIGAGNIVESIYHLSESYQQAKAVIKYMETSGNKVCLYSEILQLDDVYYYPRECDEKIYNYVVVGKLNEAKGIVGKIYKENFEDNSRMLSVRAMEMIREKIKDCIVSIADKYDISVNSALLLLKQEHNMKKYIDIIYEMIDVIGEEISSKKKSVQDNIALRIMNYVNDNYSDNALSIKQISYVFGFHENHISNLFKSAYGENLSIVIEKLRIEKACELIKNTDMKISDIAEEVGYTSDASFRRAFKKIIGVSPGEYRCTEGI